MSFFMPDLAFNKLTDINIKKLKKLNITAIILDLDNTLAAPKSMDPFDGVVEWIENIKKYKIKFVIASNGFEKRVKPFAKKLDIPFVSFSLKPSSKGLRKSIKILNEDKSKIALIGDQVFTDVLGSKLYGLKSVLLRPTVKDKSITVKIRRKFEQIVWRKIYNEQ